MKREDCRTREEKRRSEERGGVAFSDTQGVTIPECNLAQIPPDFTTSAQRDHGGKRQGTNRSFSSIIRTSELIKASHDR